MMRRAGCFLLLAFLCGTYPALAQSNLDEPYVARRVVSLIPAVTDIMRSLGASDLLVARTEDEDDPALSHLPSVGQTLRPNLEVLAAVEPDLVIAWSGSDVNALTRLVERGGGRVETMAVDDLSDLEHGITQVGGWIGRAAAADSVRAHVVENLERARTVGRRAAALQVLWVVWSEPIIVAGPGTFLHDIVEIAGGHDVMGKRGAPWPRIGFESLLRLDPDVLIWPDGPGMFPASDLRNRPGWQLLPAVQHGRVLVVDAERFHVPGPEIALSALGLAERLSEVGER